MPAEKKLCSQTLGLFLAILKNALAQLVAAQASMKMEANNCLILIDYLFIQIIFDPKP